MERKCIEKFYQNIELQEKHEVFAMALPITLIYKSSYNETEIMLKSKYNLCSSDIDVMAALYHNKSILSPTELYSAMIFSSGGMTKVLKKLECLNYITRIENPEDKRSKLVKLTKAGCSLFENCLEDIIEIKEKHFSILTEEERKSLKAILKKLALSLY